MPLVAFGVPAIAAPVLNTKCVMFFAFNDLLPVDLD
jgi:hypothetical protein